MEIIIVIAIIYLLIGFVKGVSHLSSGRVGTMGWFLTLVFTTLFWPFVPKG